MERMEYKRGRELTYAFCEDWLIYARDKEGRLFFVITEMWTEWLDCPENADQEPNAIEKYMLPVARRKWDNLTFEKYAGLDQVFWAENHTTGEVAECLRLPPVYKLAHSWKRQGDSVKLFKGWRDSNDMKDGKRCTSFVPEKTLPVLT